MPQTVEDGAAAWQRLAKWNKHPRDDRIAFYEPTHTYSIDGDSTGWVSCTGFVHSFFGHFDADETVTKILRGRKYKTDPTYKYYGMTGEAIKAQWTASGTAASEAGTRMHLDVEYFNNSSVQSDDIEAVLKAMREEDNHEPQPGPEWDYFLRYQREYVYPRGWKPFRTEWLVFESSILLCGSIDMVYIKPDGTFGITDWKRSKEIKSENSYQNGLGPLSHLPNTNLYHYTMQLNVYRALLQRNYGITVNELALVILHPNNDTYRIIPLPFMDAEVEGMFAARRAALALPGNDGHNPKVLFATARVEDDADAPSDETRGPRGWAGASDDNEEGAAAKEGCREHTAVPNRGGWCGVADE